MMRALSLVALCFACIPLVYHWLGYSALHADTSRSLQPVHCSALLTVQMQIVYKSLLAL